MSVLPVGFGSATNGGGFNVERSLRFNSADSAYLNRTPAGSGTLGVWTFSFWVKRAALGVTQTVYYSGTTNQRGGISFTSGDLINCQPFNSTGANASWTSTAVFRDPSAWYHVVIRAFSSSTGNSFGGVELALYINGVQQTFTLSTAGTPTGGDRINDSQAKQIGQITPNGGGNYLSAYLTEFNFIDGQALTPSSFGETDSNTGVWKPKAFSGTYGTNGFYLPFKTASQWSGYFDGTGDKLTSSTNAIAATGEFSVEAWVYQTARTVTSDQHIFSQYTSGATSGRWYLRFNGTTVAFTTGLGTSVSCATTVNTGTWYHVCVTRDSSNRVRVFLNGVLDGTAVISGSLDTAASVIGATQTANYWQGYISNVRAVSGEIPTAYQTASTTVGATIFTPSTSQLTAVSGTSLLTCQSSTFIDNSGLGRTITTAGDVITQQFSPFTLDVTDDHSGQGNHWQPNNLDLRTTGVGADILVDSPTSYGTDSGLGAEVRGNYCTLNPLDKTAAVTLSNGNLQALLNGINYFAKSTIAISSGKWYWEVTASATAEDMIGITKADVVTTGYFGSQATSYGYYKTNGNKYNSATGTAYGASYASGDIIGVALDLDAGTLTYYKNGVSQGTAFTGLSGTFFAGVSTAGTGGTQTINFGQRPFEKWNGSAYVANTAPSGFKALCTQNLPTPTIGATSTTQANDYFNPVLYTGNGSTNNITGVGFQPDFVWLKDRTTAFNNYLYDAVRGTTKALQSNSTNAEETRTGLTAFGSDGFTLGSQGGDNQSGDSFVAWNWKANGAGSSNTAGTITSTVSANTTSGFSIVQWTGSGANGTVGHGLGVAPQFMFMKNKTNSGTGWPSYHAFIDASAPQNYYISLADTAGRVSASNAWNNTAPTSSVFSVGSSSFSNGGTMIAYVFAPVAGYSAFGSYTGNNSDDGPFIFTNFRPAFVLIKATNTTQWWTLLDSKRDTYNVSTLGISPNSSDAESTFNTNRGPHNIDFTSNGFKIRTSGSGINGTNTFIYAAFAETPAKFSLAR